MRERSIKFYGFTAYLLAALLAGCGGSSLAPLAAAPSGQTARVTSWMSSDASARNLLYITRPYDKKVDVYSYPQDQVVGELTGFTYPVGACSDKRGNVYIADEIQDDVVEYAHGGTQPVQTLTVPGARPVACAVDRRSGDLAVTSLGNSSGTSGNVAIYPNATGTPKTYTYVKISGFSSCVYDKHGNLFVDGTPARGYGYDYEMAELPRGAQAMQSVNVQNGLPWAAPLQWDGKYLAVGQNILPQILRYTIASGYASFVSSTPLSDAYDAFAFVLAGKKAIVANLYYYDIYVARWDVLVYNFPAGGDSILDMLDTGTTVGGLALSHGAK
jgi:hypothetical protein